MHQEDGEPEQRLSHRQALYKEAKLQRLPANKPSIEERKVKGTTTKVTWKSLTPDRAKFMVRSYRNGETEARGHLGGEVANAALHAGRLGVGALLLTRDMHLDVPLLQGIHAWAYFVPEKTPGLNRHRLDDALEIKLRDEATQVGEDEHQGKAQKLARVRRVVLLNEGDAGLQRLHLLLEEGEVVPSLLTLGIVGASPTNRRIARTARPTMASTCLTQWDASIRAYNASFWAS